MGDRWFYEQSGTINGPYPVTEILFLAAEGLLRDDALLWPEGEDRRTAVVAVAAIDFRALAEPSPPAPPPPPRADATGLDPETGAVLDEAKYRRWTQEQQRRAGAAAAPERRRDPRKELADWLDRDENRLLVAAGDVATLRQTPFVAGLFRLCAAEGAHAVDRLSRYLAFLVENRRRFHRAFGERKASAP